MKEIKKTILLIALFLLPLSIYASPEAERLETKNGKAKKEDIAKKGWNFTPLPVMNYNIDMGFQFGVMGQVYHYGDGTLFPNYKHKYSVIATMYTKGAKQLDLSYDSKYLIPNMRITAALQYLDNPLNGFYGYNGAVSPYYSSINLLKSSNREDGIAFYANHQKLLSATVDIQGRIAEHLTWIAGLYVSYQDYSPLNWKCYNGKETLYYQYLDNQLIPEGDTYGFRSELKSGVIFDTRDIEANPSRGLYASITLVPGASFSDYSKGSLSLSADFRQYLSIIPSRLVFAYQLAYQGVIAGYQPFYRLPAFVMRGSFGRRVIGKGIVSGSVDLRLTAARFHLFKQNVELGIMGFADAGMVVQTYRLEQQKSLGNVTITKTIDDVTYGPYHSIYAPGIGSEKERLHTCLGGGIFFSVNKNFLVSMQLGHPSSSQDGGTGLYINLGFSF